MRRLAIVGLALLSCGKPPPPAPTVALAEAARAGVVLLRGDEKIELTHVRRVEEGAEVRTPDGGRASLRLDGGSWVLLDGKSALRVGAGKVELAQGRAWIDARDVDATTVAVPGGTLTATQAGFAVELTASGARAYCVQGQLTYAAKTSNRLEAGMAVELARSGEVKESPEAQWDDWTGGLAEPGPPRALEPAGIGQLAARREGEVGAARVPLLVRRHDVRATLDRDLVTVDVEQVFFNPRSEELEGIYTLRLPPGALLAGFEVRGEEDSTIFTQLAEEVFPRAVPAARPGESTSGAALEWAGPDRYRALVAGLAPGKTRVVHVRWIEWLARHDGRRTWVYAMGGGQPPLLGEFSLEADTARARAGGLEAAMGARVEGTKVVLRKSDFRPHSDFALDLLDGPKPPKGTVAYRVAQSDGPGKGYVLVAVDPPFGEPAPSIDLVILADTSAATDPTKLDLEKAVVDGILRQLRPSDRVALLASSLGGKPLGAGPALAPLGAGRAEALLEALAQTPPSGGTDLGAAIADAAALLPGGKGVIVYLGDGQPTVGALLPGALQDRLARLGHAPRVFTVAVGADAKQDVLRAVTSGFGGAGGLALTVEDRPDAAHAAYRILAAAATPTLRDLTYDFGPAVDVAYPIGPLTVQAGEPLVIVGRLRGDVPPRLHLAGTRDGQAFSVDVPLRTEGVVDSGDVRRRWAAGRLADLLGRGAGREAVVDIGTRFGLVTPWTALAPPSGATCYAPLDPTGTPAGTYVPEAARDQAPDDTPIALEPGVTSVASGAAGLDPLYVAQLGERDEGVRACFERKSASHPELSGRVELQVGIGLDGAVKGVKQLSSSLRDAEVEACIARAVTAMRLPAPPDGKIHTVVRAWQFEADDARLGAPARCSAASHQYVATRRGLWRERLGSNPGVEGALAVWRAATRACELKTWLDRRALLDLMLPHVGRTVYQVDLYHRFDGQPDVQAYLRRGILRGVRTPEDIRVLRGGLALDGGVAQDLLEAQLKKAKDVRGRIAVLRQFLALAPDGIALRVRLLGLLEEAGAATDLAEAKRVAWALRADPAADLAARQTVGELFARHGDPDEAARAFSEIVEFAPFDPWARRRLGDLYRAHGRFEDAYREYATLAWLAPDDGSVLLLLARAAAGAGRTDESLRLEERLAESVEGAPSDSARDTAKGTPADVASWARHWISIQLAALRDGARQKHDEALASRLAARGRSDGILGRAGDTLVAATWSHPDARLELWWTPPGDKVAQRVPVRGDGVGIEALRLGHQAAGEHLLTVHRPVDKNDPRAFDGELSVLWREGQPDEQLARLPLHFAPGVGDLSFSLHDRAIAPRGLVAATH